MLDPFVHSQDVPFPNPAQPGSAAAAESSFDLRASDIVAYNACHREVDYANIRAEMAKGNYDDEGENLTNILIAKIGWLNTSGNNCAFNWKVDRPKNVDGSPVQPNVDEFTQAMLQSWNDPGTPSSCRADSSVSATEDKLEVHFVVTPACMHRQVNEAIVAMMKKRQMGTDKFPCVPALNFAPRGDFDVNVRELVRILYSGTKSPARVPVLDQSTVDYMYENLLAARGKPSPDEYSVLSDCDEPAGDEVGSPEDTADRHAWYNEVADDIGDVFKFLFYDLPLKIGGTAISMGVGVVGSPLLLALGDNPLPMILPHYDVLVEETENHRLMIETSRYLINKDIINRLNAENYGHVDDIQGDQEKVKDWLLSRLQTVARGDFKEYNSRAYTRYSLNSILNLYDFAKDDPDPRVWKAAKIVLDLSEAKFAAGSNNGRRWPPFRRLEDNDGSHPGAQQNLYNNASGADHEIARAMVLAGQTRFFPEGLSNQGIGDLVNSAVSSYRLPRPILEAAVERQQAFAQTVAHAGVEIYYQSPAFTVTAGGKQVDSPYSTLGNSRDEDRGVAMPTTIMPTLAGVTIDDIFYFAGIGVRHERRGNVCVYKGFACGLNPHLPSWISNPGCSLSKSKLTFINSAKCFPGNWGPHFYLAALIDTCGANCSGNQYGLMEIVQAPSAIGNADDPNFDNFVTLRTAALNAAGIGAGGFGVYTNSFGETIKYGISDDAAVVDVNGATVPPITTSGGVLNADGTGKATIRSPSSGAIITIDFSDNTNPTFTP